MTFDELTDFLISVVRDHGVSRDASIPFCLGFLQGAVVTAMARMTEEEKRHFFPGLMSDKGC